MIGEKELRKICQQVLKRCRADAAEVLLFTENNSLTRFANNMIHQNVAESNISLTLRYFIGKRVGIASTNRLDDTALDELTEHARQSAKASPEDPDYPGLPEPASYTEVQSYHAATAECSPEQRASAVGAVCRLANEKGLNASGAFSTGEGEVAVANSQGLFASHLASTADFSTVVMGSDSSGWAQSSGWRVTDISPEMLGREAIEKAERGCNPRRIEPGNFTVVLDPYATEDILSSLNYYGMGAQSVLEGQSWMVDRIGQKAMSEQISIRDDGYDPQGSPMPFDFEGVPKQSVDIVKNGVVVGPVYDRYTARKAGVTSTGHALPPTMRGMGPIAINLFIAPGQATVEEMIRSTERGVYITRFWYTRLVHPRDCVITGMTRDGAFWIENGEIAYPVKNLRFTQSYVEALNNVAAVGEHTILLLSEFGGIATRVPALKITGFNFTGSTV